MEKSIYAGVYLVDAPFYSDSVYTYCVPDTLAESVRIGSFVSVPFGSSYKRQTAVVVSLFDKSPVSKEIKIKPIISLVYRDFVLDGEFLRLASFMRKTTFCTFGQAVKTIIPPSVLSRREGRIEVKREPESPLGDKLQEDIYSFVAARGPVSADKIYEKYGPHSDKAVNILVSEKILGFENEKESVSSFKTKKVASLAVSAEKAKEYSKALGERADKTKKVCDYLIKEGSSDISEMTRTLGAVSYQIKKLEKDGIIRIDLEEYFRDPYEGKNYSYDTKSPLSDEQAKAFSGLKELYSTGKANAALLYGVTGSGKTRIIKAMADEVIGDGRKVIILIPEISLTPQTVGFFKSCYKNRIAVIHSSLSAGERADMWNRIRRGDVDICIGTRSAVFAPFENIGMIVIDEEQEHTYKSDSDPKYHARDIARFRCASSGALMLLSSATPSVESMYKAKNGKYSLFELKGRYGEATLPNVEVIDMREESVAGNPDIISSGLKEEIKKTIEKGEQAILFLNRRGYHNFAQCRKCGGVIVCSHCSVAMTYHTYSAENGRGGGYLSCHYCGRRIPVPDTCPSCGEGKLTFVGYGTQKLEDEIEKTIPGSRVLRMDADTTGVKDSYDRIIGSFERGEADILIGTQMVAKGHDFPNVTLSAVLNADSLMYADDYHAAEKTFGLICQLEGRSGRGDKKGKAYIQTYNPTHPVIKLAARQDYTGFYKNEDPLRRSLVFPPYCDIVLITLISSDESLVGDSSKKISESIKEYSKKEEYKDIVFESFGPFEAPIYKVKEKFRVRVVIKCRLSDHVRDFIRDITSEWSKKLYRSATVSIDVNPSSL